MFAYNTNAVLLFLLMMTQYLKNDHYISGSDFQETNDAIWGVWGSWSCVHNRNLCYSIRHRTCSTGDHLDCYGADFDYVYCEDGQCIGKCFLFCFVLHSTVSVLCSRSAFHPRHNGQWPPTWKDFHSRLYPLLNLLNLNSWEGARFSFFSVECQTRELLVPFL